MFESTGDKSPKVTLGAFATALFIQTHQILELIKISVVNDNPSMLGDMARSLYEIRRRLQILHTASDDVPDVSEGDLCLHDIKRSLSDAKKHHANVDSKGSREALFNIQLLHDILKERGASANRADKAYKQWDETFPEEKNAYYSNLCEFVHNNLFGIEKLYIREDEHNVHVEAKMDGKAMHWVLHLVNLATMYSNSVYIIVYGENSESDNYLDQFSDFCTRYQAYLKTVD